MDSRVLGTQSAGGGRESSAFRASHRSTLYGVRSLGQARICGVQTPRRPTFPGRDLWPFGCIAGDRLAMTMIDPAASAVNGSCRGCGRNPSEVERANPVATARSINRADLNASFQFKVICSCIRLRLVDQPHMFVALNDVACASKTFQPVRRRLDQLIFIVVFVIDTWGRAGIAINANESLVLLCQISFEIGNGIREIKRGERCL